MFKLKENGLELVEIAPGIDIDKHILPYMAFKPIINEPQLMDKRIFIDEPMGLINDLLNLNLDQRITYDARATSCSSTSRAGMRAPRRTSTNCARR